jgi:hypothetical protein
LISGGIGILLAIVLGIYWRKELLGLATRGRPTPA